ncbi:MAG: exopolysaccharide biosynthesis protein [Pseudomonadota bacterium]
MDDQRNPETLQPDDLQSLLKLLVTQTEGERVSLGELVQAFGHRSFGPMLLVPAIIAVAPTGAIPGMSIVTGTIIMLVALQMLIGRDHVWLPNRLLSFEFSRQSLKTSVERAGPWAERVDWVVGERFTVLTQKPLNRFIPVICVLLALSMYPLALLPFAVAIPGTAVGLLALGLTFRDGVLVGLGYTLAALAAYVLVAWF